MKKQFAALWMICSLILLLTGCAREPMPEDFEIVPTKWYAAPHYCISAYHGAETNIVIPDELNGHEIKGVEDRAFYHTDIEKVTFPKDAIVVGYEAFHHCRRLKSIDLGDHMERILTFAFADCISLEEVTIPASVYEITKAFCGCTSLKKVVFLGDAPKNLGVGIFESDRHILMRDQGLTVYYPKDAEGWTDELIAEFEKVGFAMVAQ